MSTVLNPSQPCLASEISGTKGAQSQQEILIILKACKRKQSELDLLSDVLSGH